MKIKIKDLDEEEEEEGSMQIDSNSREIVDQPPRDLTLLKDFWLKFCSQMKSMSDMCLYLERTYLITGLNMSFMNESKQGSFRNLSPVGSCSLWQLGLRFLRVYLGEIDLKDKLINGVLALIKQERLNSTISNQQIITKLIHILLALSLYKGEFEQRFIEESKRFYEER